MASNFLRTPILSHGQKVCREYKRACRNIQGHFGDKVTGAVLTPRLHMLRLRKAIDSNKNLNLEESKKALEALVKYRDSMTPVTFYQFATSPGGHNYAKALPPPDWILDTWHPLEKAQYPEYFAKRDIRKREAVERNNVLYQQELEKVEELEKACE